jgi:hypothetical protein
MVYGWEVTTMKDEKKKLNVPKAVDQFPEDVDRFDHGLITATIKRIDKEMGWDLPTDVIEHLICCIEIRQAPELNDQVSLVELSDNISALEKPMLVKDVNNYEEKLCEANQESKRSGNSIPVKDAPTAQGPTEIFALTERFEFLKRVIHYDIASLHECPGLDKLARVDKIYTPKWIALYTLPDGSVLHRVIDGNLIFNLVDCPTAGSFTCLVANIDDQNMTKIYFGMERIDRDIKAARRKIAEFPAIGELTNQDREAAGPPESARKARGQLDFAAATEAALVKNKYASFEPLLAVGQPLFQEKITNLAEKVFAARQESKRSGNSIPVKDAPTAQGPMEIFALTERFEDHVTMLRIDQDNPCIDNPSARLNIYSAYFSTEFPKRLHVEGTGRIGPGPWETLATSGWAKCPLNPNLSAAEAIAAIECWEQAYHIEPPGPRDGEFTLCMDKDKRPVARVDDISMEIFDARVFHQNPDTLSIRGLALSNALAFGPIRACKAIGWAEDKIKPGMSAAEAISTIKRWSKTIFIPQLYQLK